MRKSLRGCTGSPSTSASLVNGGRTPARKILSKRRLEEAQRGNAQLGLLRVLHLTPEQRGQIGAIRRETEPQRRLLAARLRQARRALDEAMYSDHANEALIDARVREVGEAQTAIVRLRAATELKIRRVLSPEQLNAFRQLQQRSRTRQQQQQQRRNQTLLPGNIPEGATPAERLRNRRQRRRQERQQQQQQPSMSAPEARILSAPRERLWRNARPPR